MMHLKVANGGLHDPIHEHYRGVFTF